MNSAFILGILGGLGGTEIIVILIIILLLFGGKKIPELMKGLGQGMKEFKDASKGKQDSEIEKNKILMLVLKRYSKRITLLLFIKYFKSVSIYYHFTTSIGFNSKKNHL